MPTISPLSALPSNDLVSIFGDAERHVAGQATQAALAITKKKNMTPEQVTKAAQDFEAVFLGQMLQAMFPEAEENPLFGGTESDETFRTMMVDEYAKSIAASGGIGIADHIQRELLGEASITVTPRRYDLPIGEKIEAYEKTKASSEVIDKTLQGGAL